MKNMILQYEKYFFRADFCQNKLNLENRLSDKFCEYSCSGNIHNKHSMINELKNISEDRPIEIFDFELRVLCEDNLLVHYKSYDKVTNTSALRTSIWKKENNLWKIFFHQGTNYSEI